MKTIKVLILKNTVQTGSHYGKKGQIVEVPEPVAQQWVALKAAEVVKEKPAKV